ncbi:monovalent cation/H+ antiporter complex subunit F [Gordonia alkaliphila]|uniref:Monovalent cation/H+ antiporter complex subunit F n=1 Tax=Gordonia alkaliphila TaxID=1053547 RepID=A0ABP8ZG64_9ACTN|nr:monovalent cation/H+ antiporter complex subunit F [Gordonia alkaliphila]MCK0438752.1 monovalent cation/H+ antiporter complex subunit F [Gordonia alkaliphila]
MTIVWAISGAMLMTAILLTLYRSLRGPTTLDRLVGIDTLVAMIISSLAVWVAATYNTTIVPGIVVLSLVSFIGTVSVARFRVRDDA